MFAAGTTAGPTYAGPVTGTANGRGPSRPKATGSMNAAHDDRAAASIQDPLHLERSGRGHVPDAQQQLSAMQANVKYIKSSLATIREKGVEATKFQANAEPDRALWLLENPSE